MGQTAGHMHNMHVNITQSNRIIEVPQHAWGGLDSLDTPYESRGIL